VAALLLLVQNYRPRTFVGRGLVPDQPDFD